MFLASALIVCLAGAQDSTVIKNRRLERNQPVAKALEAAGVDGPTIDAVQGALQAAEFNFKKARAGDQLRLVFRKAASSSCSTTAAAC